MTSEQQYPKRLIEVDLPIKEISAHARREKSIRHGHISTLHLWWARRPLAACRAVTCAALWPDPADPLCPQSFRNAVAEVLYDFAETARTDAEVLGIVQPHWTRWNRLNRGAWQPDNPASWWDMRYALLDFIVDYSNWDSSNVPAFLESAQSLTAAAAEALTNEADRQPLLLDSFAGGGAIPLEALRSGSQVFASDMNPVAVLLNRVLLEYIPRFGAGLAEEVRRWGTWVHEQARTHLTRFYPPDADGAIPVAFLWARTIKCEGPGCGVCLPLIQSRWLSKKGSGTVIELVPGGDNTRIEFKIIDRPAASEVGEGTIRNGSATCPCCGYTTPNKRVRAQLSKRHGGASDAEMIAVAVTRPGQRGRTFRAVRDEDLAAARDAVKALAEMAPLGPDGLSPVPDEPISAKRPSPNARGFSAVTRIGISRFGDLFTPRQCLTLATYSRLINEAGKRILAEETDPELAKAVATILALSLSRFSDICNANCRWESSKTQVRNLFTRQAAAIVWDFAEPNVFSRSAGDYSVTLDTMLETLLRLSLDFPASGQAVLASATEHPLPDDIADAFFTDPPYYDAIPYADLSDFFYVWLRRSLMDLQSDLFADELTPKDEEAIWNPSREYSKTGKPKDEHFYETQMARAFEEGRRITTPGGVGVVVFAHKSTAGWEAVLGALLDAGWTATASWPLDTELGNRVNAMGTASLASSVHIVCRPRENPDGSLRTNTVGDWRSVLRELPERIRDWMPRLAKEGVVGADAIFACLGPALEIFSRYSHVEKATGERVELREYLEQVWAAVAREALAMVFEDADATGLEEDARLTAMWLWTLSTANESEVERGSETEVEKVKPNPGFTLEFDAARKIAQGLGAHLDNLGNLVEIKGDKARLLPVAERTKYLFGKDVRQQAPTSRRGKPKQMTLFAELEAAEEEAGWGDTGIPSAGETTLDRVHQAMILFAAGRAEALKRFLVEEGVGGDTRLWMLAQSLSALYPAGTEEKRWVDGVLARKKGLGFG